jgi:hypothetical protein
MRNRVVKAYLARKAATLPEVTQALLGALEGIAVPLEEASGEATQLREFIEEARSRMQKEPENLDLAKRLLTNLRDTIRDLWFNELKEDAANREKLQQPLNQLENFLNYSSKSS